MHPSRKIYQNRTTPQDHQDHRNVTAPTQASPAPSIPIPAELQPLFHEKKVLQKKIEEIGNRLRFGYSDALHDYQLQLIKEDVTLSCKLVDALTA